MSNNVLGPGAQSRFPGWFDAQAQELGLDPLSAANMFINWINSPEGSAVFGGNAANLGPYWSQFAPGGALAGQGIDSVDPRFQFGEPPAPTGPGPDPNRGASNPTADVQTTPGNTGVSPNAITPQNRHNAGPPPQPTDPPAGAPPGHWLLRGNRTAGYSWKWLANDGSGFFEPPAPTAPPPATTPQLPTKPHTNPNKPPVTKPAPPVDPFDYYSVATTGNQQRMGGAGPGGPPPSGPALQPNQRPRLTPTTGAGPGGNRPTGPQPRPRRPSTVTGGNDSF